MSVDLNVTNSLNTNNIDDPKVNYNESVYNTTYNNNLNSNNNDSFNDNKETYSNDNKFNIKLTSLCSNTILAQRLNEQNINQNITNINNKNTNNLAININKSYFNNKKIDKLFKYSKFEKVLKDIEVSYTGKETAMVYDLDLLTNESKDLNKIKYYNNYNAINKINIVKKLVKKTFGPCYDYTPNQSVAESVTDKVNDKSMLNKTNYEENEYRLLSFEDKLESAKTGLHDLKNYLFDSNKKHKEELELAFKNISNFSTLFKKTKELEKFYYEPVLTYNYIKKISEDINLINLQECKKDDKKYLNMFYSRFINKDTNVKENYFINKLKQEYRNCKDSNFLNEEERNLYPLNNYQKTNNKTLINKLNNSISNKNINYTQRVIQDIDNSNNKIIKSSLNFYYEEAFSKHKKTDVLDSLNNTSDTDRDFINKNNNKNLNLSSLDIFNRNNTKENNVFNLKKSSKILADNKKIFLF